MDRKNKVNKIFNKEIQEPTNYDAKTMKIVKQQGGQMANVAFNEKESMSQKATIGKKLNPKDPINLPKKPANTREFDILLKNAKIDVRQSMRMWNKLRDWMETGGNSGNHIKLKGNNVVDTSDGSTFIWKSKDFQAMVISVLQALRKVGATSETVDQYFDDFENAYADAINKYDPLDIAGDDEDEGLYEGKITELFRQNQTIMEPKLGDKPYDGSSRTTPGKKMSIAEGGKTHVLELLMQIGKLPDIDIVKSNYLADGAEAIITDKYDGQEYKLTLKPIKKQAFDPSMNEESRLQPIPQALLTKIAKQYANHVKSYDLDIEDPINVDEFLEDNYPQFKDRMNMPARIINLALGRVNEIEIESGNDTHKIAENSLHSAISFGERMIDANYPQDRVMDMILSKFDLDDEDIDEVYFALFPANEGYKEGQRVTVRGKKGTVIKYTGKTPNAIAVQYDQGGTVFPETDHPDLKSI